MVPLLEQAAAPGEYLQFLSDLPASLLFKIENWRWKGRNCHFQTPEQLSRKADSYSTFYACWEAYTSPRVAEWVSQVAHY